MKEQFTFGELIFIWDALQRMPKRTRIEVYGETIHLSDLKDKVKRIGEYTEREKNGESKEA